MHNSVQVDYTTIRISQRYSIGSLRITLQSRVPAGIHLLRKVGDTFWQGKDLYECFARPDQSFCTPEAAWPVMHIESSSCRAGPSHCRDDIFQARGTVWSASFAALPSPLSLAPYMCHPHLRNSGNMRAEAEPRPADGDSGTHEEPCMKSQRPYIRR